MILDAAMLHDDLHFQLLASYSVPELPDKRLLRVSATLPDEVRC